MKTINKTRKRKTFIPIKATVILVALTITTAVAVAYWMSGITGQYTKIDTADWISDIIEQYTKFDVADWLSGIIGRTRAHTTKVR